LEREITSIVVLAAADDAVAPAELVPEPALNELASSLTIQWASATVRREPPPIWMWEPLIDAGIISLAGMVAIIEIRMQDDPAEKLALRSLLRSWLSRATWGVRIHIIWAHQKITYVEEILEPGISEEMERYGREAEVERSTGQAAQGGGQVRALHPHRRRTAGGASRAGVHAPVGHR
jgi:hypothetical protein